MSTYRFSLREEFSEPPWRILKNGDLLLSKNDVFTFVSWINKRPLVTGKEALIINRGKLDTLFLFNSDFLEEA
jgi:hypothetical protein